jgi:hypothetical protein
MSGGKKNRTMNHLTALVPRVKNGKLQKRCRVITFVRRSFPLLMEHGHPYEVSYTARNVLRPYSESMTDSILAFPLPSTFPFSLHAHSSDHISSRLEIGNYFVDLTCPLGPSVPERAEQDRVHSMQSFL